MSDSQPAPRWRVLVTPRWLSWHAFAVVAFIGMFWLGDWQFRRAMAGNTLSWAYTFEWPIFAVFGAVFWVKTVRDELHPSTPAPAREVALPVGARSLDRAGGDGGPDVTDAAPAEDPVVEDTELAEYNAYLALLNKEVKRHGKWHGLR